MKETGEKDLILLAEDDNLVRSMMKSALSMHGYDVLSAEDGDEAIKIFRKNKGSIALAIVDHAMPKKNGPDVIERIHSSSPEIPAIITSGFRLRERNLSYSPDHKIAYVNKPYPLEMILELVDEMIEGNE